MLVLFDRRVLPCGGLYRQLNDLDLLATARQRSSPCTLAASDRAEHVVEWWPPSFPWQSGSRILRTPLSPLRLLNQLRRFKELVHQILNPPVPLSFLHVLALHLSLAAL